MRASCSLAHDAANIDPFKSEPALLLANFYSLRGQHSKADAFYSRALLLNPDHQSNYAKRCLTNFKQRQQTISSNNFTINQQNCSCGKLKHSNRKIKDSDGFELVKGGNRHRNSPPKKIITIDISSDDDNCHRLTTCSPHGDRTARPRPHAAA